VSTPIDDVLDDLVDEHLRVETSLLRDPIHLRGMLVGSRQEERVLASLAVMAHEDVDAGAPPDLSAGS